MRANQLRDSVDGETASRTDRRAHTGSTAGSYGRMPTVPRSYAISISPQGDGYLFQMGNDHREELVEALGKLTDDDLYRFDRVPGWPPGPRAYGL